MEAFLQWMGEQGYSSGFSSIYRENYSNPVLRAIMDTHFDVREGKRRFLTASLEGYSKFKREGPLEVKLVDVVPEDEGAEFEVTPRKVLGVLEAFLTERFGKTIEITRRRMDMDYGAFFGDAIHSVRQIRRTFFDVEHPSLRALVNQFEPPCWLRFTAQSLDGKPVVDMAEIRRCALMMGEANHLTEDLHVLDTYAHEFGHSLGLCHQFVDPHFLIPLGLDRQLVDANMGKWVGVDDVMVMAIKPVNPRVGHYLGPLSRYALEPPQGYEDDGDFGPRYNQLYPKY